MTHTVWAVTLDGYPLFVGETRFLAIDTWERNRPGRAWWREVKERGVKCERVTVEAAP